MSEENLKEGKKKKRVWGWKSFVLATIITIALFGGVSFMVIYLLPLERTYDSAYLQMDVYEKMPDDYFPTLLKFNETFLEEYGGVKQCGYAFEEGKLVGYECIVSFEKEKPTKEEILNHLLIHKCLQYEKDTARGGGGAYFKIIAPKMCALEIYSFNDHYIVCTYLDSSRMSPTCAEFTRICAGSSVYGYYSCTVHSPPTEKILVINVMDDTVTNITVPFQEKWVIMMGGKDENKG